MYLESLSSCDRKKSFRKAGIIMANGLLSTSNTVLPFNREFTTLSGLSVVMVVGNIVFVVCAKIEEELSSLSLEDREIFLDDLGISESGLDKLIKALYGLLGLKTFFTSGTDEVRAWTFKSGMKAPECAGIIHSDFERGFIKAEVMSFGDLKELGSEKAVKEAGRLRLEGKEYEMQDGDICYFRFNV